MSKDCVYEPRYVQVGADGRKRFAPISKPTSHTARAVMEWALQEGLPRPISIVHPRKASRYDGVAPSTYLRLDGHKRNLRPVRRIIATIRCEGEDCDRTVEVIFGSKLFGRGVAVGSFVMHGVPYSLRSVEKVSDRSCFRVTAWSTQSGRLITIKTAEEPYPYFFVTGWDGGLYTTGSALYSLCYHRNSRDGYGIRLRVLPSYSVRCRFPACWQLGRDRRGMDNRIAGETFG